MKLSDKILLGFLALVVATGVAFLVALRAAATTPAKNGLHMHAFDTDSLAYQGEPFTSVEVIGGWETNIARGDTHSVTIQRDEGNDTKVRAWTHDGILTIMSSTMALGTDDVTATITCPGLRSLSTSGAAKTTVVGFDEDSLVVTSAGGTQVSARDCNIGWLGLNLTGMSDINTQGSAVGEAAFNTAGAYGVALVMDNGTLSGRADGMGGIQVYGTVGKNTLTTSGMVEVTFHDKSAQPALGNYSHAGRHSNQR